MGYSLPSVTASALTLPTPGPYTGTAAQIPGKIEIENYDIGNSGISFFDADAGNSGGKYRTDNVDIEDCADTGGGYSIGWTNSGEWLIYTVDVNDTIVDIELRIASNYGGSLKLELDGKLLGQKSFTGTGNWSTWTTVSIHNVKVEKGKNRKLKVSFLGAGFNINWINFTKSVFVGVQNIDDEGFKIYPNPASQVLNIESVNLLFNKIEIFDLTGRILFSKKIESQQKCQIAMKLADGNYYLKISNRKQYAIKQFVVQN